MKELLESILHRKITNIVIRNDVALDKTYANDKLMELDILAEIDGKEKINVELQNKNEYNIIKRGDAYASKIYSNSLKSGYNYNAANRTVIIWILGYNAFEDSPYHECGKMMKVSNNEVLSENITYHYFQLPKFIEEVRRIETPEEQWLAYLSCQLNNEELEELFNMNKSIEEINKLVDMVIEDQDVQDALTQRFLDNNLEYLKMERAMENVARKMLKNKVDINIISDSTGLSIEEIEKLKQ